MFKLTYNQIIQKIKEEKGLKDEDIQKKINKKLEILGDLISKEGAAHIVANELGIKVFEDLGNKKLSVAKIVPGMNSVNLDVKVINNFGIREFKTEKREGRVANLFVGDETGMCRLVVWDEKLIKLIENGSIDADCNLRISNAYSKENNGFCELHLGNRANIEINPSGLSIGIQQKKQFMKKQIKDLREGEFVSLEGTIVQIFEPRFYSACTQCGKKLDFSDGKFMCNEHGADVGVDVPILNIVFDDGSDNLRVVFFRDLVNKLVEKDISEFKDNPSTFEDVKKDLLGKQIGINGRVNKNEMFQRIEFRANDIYDLNPVDIANNLVEQVEDDV